MKLTLPNILKHLIPIVALVVAFAAVVLPAEQPSAGNNIVTRVADGDTVYIVIGQGEKAVRLLGIDTPETVHPQVGTECFGEEASLKTKDLLLGQEVYYEFDPSQGETDRYGRLLLYVWRKDDNLFVNKYLVEQGYANEYTYNSPYNYQAEFKAAEQSARERQLGLWGTICEQTRDE